MAIVIRVSALRLFWNDVKVSSIAPKAPVMEDPIPSLAANNLSNTSPSHPPRTKLFKPTSNAVTRAVLITFIKPTQSVLPALSVKYSTKLDKASPAAFAMFLRMGSITSRILVSQDAPFRIPLKISPMKLKSRRIPPKNFRILDPSNR